MRIVSREAALKLDGRVISKSGIHFVVPRPGTGPGGSQKVPAPYYEEVFNYLLDTGIFIDIFREGENWYWCLDRYTKDKVGSISEPNSSYHEALRVAIELYITFII
jgi:hypothetical protein